MPKIIHLIGSSPEAMVPIVLRRVPRPWRRLIGSFETELGWYNNEPFISSDVGSEFTNLVTGVPVSWVKTSTNAWIEVV